MPLMFTEYSILTNFATYSPQFDIIIKQLFRVSLIVSFRISRSVYFSHNIFLEFERGVLGSHILRQGNIFERRIQLSLRFSSSSSVLLGLG
jgi:hypothetical protein